MKLMGWLWVVWWVMWHKALGITTRIAEDEVNEWCGG
jgi:hypothetical protein